ncbi:hypothetical protein Tco_0233197 [Tanacetum coccineum]
MLTSGVVIRDTPRVFVSKKAPAKDDRCKGIDLLSDVALLKAAQLKKALKKIKMDSHMLHASGSSEEVSSQPKVLDDANDNNGEDSDHVNDDDDGDGDADDDNKNDDEEEDYKEEYVHTPENYEFTDDEEDYEELYQDVNVRLTDPEHEEEEKRDAKMTDAGLDDATQEKSYEQVKEDAHVTLTATYVTQKSEADNEVASMLNVKVRHEEPSTQTPSLLTIPVTVIPETSTAAVPTIPPTIIATLPQQTTPTPAPTTKPSTTSIHTLPDFLSLFGFDQRVSVLEKEPSQLKQMDYAAQLLRKRYIDLVEKFVKDIIKDEVKSQLPQILPKELSDFATPVIQSTIFESLENVVFAKSSSQPQYTYEAAASLTEFELKKMMKKSKSYQGAQEHREFYDGLVKSYNLDKDLLDSYGKTYSLTRDRKDKDKDEDPPAGSDQGLKKQKTSKDAEPSTSSKSKESKLRSSKSTKSQPKSVDQGRQVVPVDYFINNDLEYLKGGSSNRKYMTSKTKTKAAKYDN